ncbi:MAG: glucose-1-phosphate thymidylyltransferase, partial [Muribaculaceae bacterium]|nr:glucose-1-phosphate thymidylyltransferase [Muribaculaceae bacterium]
MANNIILFDSPAVRGNLLPLTYTRPVAEIRFGILTFTEKWQKEFPEASISHYTQDYLRDRYSVDERVETALFIAGHIAPDANIVSCLQNLKEGEALKYGEDIIAYHGSFERFINSDFAVVKDYTEPLLEIKMLYDVFMKNGEALERDFRKITTGRASQPISGTNTVIGVLQFPDGLSKIFIEPGASVEGTYLNVNGGPIYIGRNAEIMEGSAIRAPFAACENAVVNMCTRITGATTLGPYCKVGGELNNVVMLGYSNKAHDGFLGNAIIGEWCNIGGGTTASNLKNDYTEIKLWNYPTQRFLHTGLQFCGLIMGDHSKIGINCMLNTATVLGVGVNIYGAGFPRNFVASFSEGGASGYVD